MATRCLQPPIRFHAVTRPLRRQHLITWLILGPVTLLLLIVAIATRPGALVQPPPAQLEGTSP